MNYLTLGIGLLAIGYSIFSIFIRIKNPSKFIKLDAMKKLYGEKIGTIFHIISYSIIPLVIGIVFVIMGIQGKKIF